MLFYTPNLNDLVIIISALLIISQHFESRHQKLSKDLLEKLQSIKVDIAAGRVTNDFVNKRETIVLKLSQNRIISLHGFVITFFIFLLACIGFLVYASCCYCEQTPCLREESKLFFPIISITLLLVTLFLAFKMYQMRNEKNNLNSEVNRFEEQLGLAKDVADALSPLNPRP